MFLKLMDGTDDETQAAARRACFNVLLLCSSSCCSATSCASFGVPLSMVRVVGGIVILMRIGFELFSGPGRHDVGRRRQARGRVLRSAGHADHVRSRCDRDGARHDVDGRKSAQEVAFFVAVAAIARPCRHLSLVWSTRRSS